MQSGENHSKAKLDANIFETKIKKIRFYKYPDVWKDKLHK